MDGTLPILAAASDFGPRSHWGLLHYGGQCNINSWSALSGDEQYDVSQLIPKLWFHVSWKAKTDYYVVDDMLVGEHLTIALLQLKDPSFNVSHWYAEQRKQILGLTNSKRYCHCIGDVISVVALKLLTDGILSSYPCTDQWLNADS